MSDFKEMSLDSMHKRPSEFHKKFTKFKVSIHKQKQ